MTFSRAGVAVAGVLLLQAAEPGRAQAPTPTTENFCSRTAEVARTACLAEVRDSYWTTVGRCLNTSNEAERSACLAAARQERTESTEECGEQFDARIDLCHLVGEAPYDPEFAPKNFVNPLDIGRSVAPNRFFPLVPGSKWFYRGATETVTVEVLGKVEKVAGVPCTVVRDTVKEDGQITEDTLDFFAQQVDGTVWYCGELTKELEDGRIVTLEGSWMAGEDLARPGVIMKGAPHVGDVYRQEFALGDAEDAAKIISLAGSATVPAASCQRSCLVTREFTPLEPDASERKYYAPNIGPILTVDRTTGERTALVRYHIP